MYKKTSLEVTNGSVKPKDSDSLFWHKKNYLKYGLCVALLIILVTQVAFFVMLPSIVVYAQEVEVDTPTTKDISATDSSLQWQKYLEEKIVPGVILVVTAIGSIYIAIAPILSKVKKASGKFESATTDINKATNNTIENSKKVASLEDRLDKIEKATINTEEITRIGFCNLEELVAKGYANEISKVGGEDEKEKLEG